MRKNIIVIAIVVLALIACSGIYWWQHSELIQLEKGFQEQIIALGGHVDQLQNTNGELQQKIDELTQIIDQLQKTNGELQQKIAELTKIPEKYIKIIYPVGGERLCFEDNVNIRWESKGVESVRIYLDVDNIGQVIDIVPATYNEEGNKGIGIYSWKVGSTKGGDFYGSDLNQIIIHGMDSDNKLVSTVKTKIFSIDLCKG